MRRPAGGAPGRSPPGSPFDPPSPSRGPLPVVPGNPHRTPARPGGYGYGYAGGYGCVPAPVGGRAGGPAARGTGRGHTGNGPGTGWGRNGDGGRSGPSADDRAMTGAERIGSRNVGFRSPSRFRGAR
ncbi:hypothetical protein GCM10027160_03610 [Streptomyces calidiresistens]